MSNSPRTKSLASYADIETVLHNVELHDRPRLEYKLETAADAHSWRYRANAYRCALRHNEEIQFSLPPNTGTSKYDHLIFRIDKSQPTTVIIDKKAVTGTLMVPGESKPISIKTPTLDLGLSDDDF